MQIKQLLERQSVGTLEWAPADLSVVFINWRHALRGALFRYIYLVTWKVLSLSESLIIVISGNTIITIIMLENIASSWMNAFGEIFVIMMMKKSASSCWALITIFMRTACSPSHARRFVYQGFLFQCCFCSIYLFILSNKCWGGRLNERPEVLMQVKRQEDQMPGHGESVHIQ